MLIVAAAGVFLTSEAVRIAVTPGGHHSVDFLIFWQAAREYFHGENIYANALSAQTAGYVYPPLVAALAAPLGLLSFHAAVAIYSLLLVTAVVGSLWFLGVRDWRCYAAVLVWPAVFSSITVGTISPLLLLGAAATWRFRNSRLVFLVVGTTAAAKLFMWPLVVWLWSTGRRTQAIACVVGATVAVVVAWARLDFTGMAGYPALVRHLSDLEAPTGYSPIYAVGGTAAIVLVSLAGAVAIWVVRGDESRAFVVAIAVALLATPILWLHYLVLLAAVAGRRFGLIWLVPALLWITPYQQANGTAFRIVVASSVIACVCWLRMRRLPPPVLV
jgi:alpha-1,2-mannosyltransferase